MSAQATSLLSNRNDALKHELLARMKAGESDFSVVLNDFFKSDCRNKEDYIALAKNIIELIDSTLSDDNFDESLFLKNTVKPFIEMREQAIDLLAQLEEQSDITQQYAQPAVSADMVTVYILLFQSQGHDIDKWAQLLGSLGRYVLGRPIYEHESDVQKVIRTKMLDGQEAYVKAAVPQSALTAMSGLSQRKDRYGNILVSLPVGAVSSQHILEFVHGKKRYHYIKGELIDVSSSTKRD